MNQRAPENYVDFIGSNLSTKPVSGAPLNGELGTGTVEYTRDDTPVLRITFAFDGFDAFREVIVAKKYEGFSVPFPVAGLMTKAATASLPSTPSAAEADAKTFLGISSNYGLDRWWVKSTDTQSVSTYSAPTQSGYSFYMRVEAIHDDSTLAIVDFYTKVISSTRRDVWLLAAHPESHGPQIYPDETSFTKELSPNTTLDQAGTSTFGSNYEKWEIKETIQKLSPSQSFPVTWW